MAWLSVRDGFIPFDIKRFSQIPSLPCTHLSDSINLLGEEFLHKQSQTSRMSPKVIRWGQPNIISERKVHLNHA